MTGIKRMLLREARTVMFGTRRLGLILLDLSWLTNCCSAALFWCIQIHQDHAQLRTLVAGYSVEDGTVLLDISGLDSLQMQNDSHAVIGAGIKLGPLYLGLHQNGGRAFPAGVCPAVGAGGHLTGRQPLPAVLMIFAFRTQHATMYSVQQHTIHQAFPAGFCPAVGARGHLTGQQLPPAVLITNDFHGRPC